MGDGILSVRPHGIHVAIDGKVYCVDERRHAIAVFTGEGVFEGWIGTPDVPSDTGIESSDADVLADRLRTIRRTAGPFNLPTHVAFSADGEMFVTDGYGNAAIHRMTSEGKLLETWGSPGESPGQFRVPHYDCFVDDEHLAVCDRENGRMQIFSPTGELEMVWPSQRPSGIALSAQSNLLYVSELGVDAGTDLFARGVVASAESPRVTIWTREGDRVGELCSATDDPTDPGSFILPHGIAVDSRGSIYVAETTTTYRNARQTATSTGQRAQYGARVDCGSMPAKCHSLQKFQPSSSNSLTTGR
jgi:DNA-binding beta-propeller fold protein YncE